MAEMIPESISANSEATAGEKRIFRLLQDALTPDEDFLVWYEPKIIDRYSDFIIFSQRFGLIAVEVKDWVISNIKEFNPRIFKGIFHGVEKEVANPVAQARDVATRIMELLRSISSLVHLEGEFRNKLKFPVGHCAILANISRAQAQEKGLLSNAQILGDFQTLFSDDISFDVDDKEQCREFITKLKKTFTVKYYFEPLTYNDLNALRFAIFPEVRVNVSKIRKLRTAEDEELLKTLDLQQERTAKSLGEGHRILKGVAGSGKTLVLACRVKYLKQIHPRWRILVVCFNISLRQYLRQLIQVSGNSGTVNNDIDIFHFHGLVKELTNANLTKLPDESEDEYDIRVGRILIGAIAEGRIKKGIYDAILIDEGQDFTTEWMQGLSQLLNENSDSLLFCYDPAQNVFGKRKPNWKTAGFKVQGKKPSELKKSYRNTVEILSIATKLGRIDAQAKQNTDDIIDCTLFPEIATKRHGELPVLKYFQDDESLVDFILDEIGKYIEQKECTFADIGVLYTDWKVLPPLFLDKFEKVFGADKCYWVTRDRESKINLDISSNDVKLLTLESCKGLEFRIVFFSGLEDLPKRTRDEESQRSLAYVGLTRAQDVLYVTALRKSGYVEELDNILASMKPSEYLPR
ncbi:MAG TPA: 3'-5' exonuclease [bacterium]|nr:3'-5' exonuclease [bacterium]HQJ66080.1 3'-5' exonuclease [bacterium]